jgi:hypothetical protein
MKTFFAFLLMTLAGPCFGADLTGNWAAKDPLPDGTFRTTYLDLHEEGERITGTIRVGQFYYKIVETTPAADGFELTGSMMDYALPRADDVPSFTVDTKVTPCTHNPLGSKGCGEAGAIGAPAAMMNAVLDALAPVGVTHLDMPASPHRVWRAIREARAHA